MHFLAVKTSEREHSVHRPLEATRAAARPLDAPSQARLLHDVVHVLARVHRQAARDAQQLPRRQRRADRLELQQIRPQVKSESGAVSGKYRGGSGH